ncbi:MAG: recombinase family protein [Gordonia paraffinivorans]
MNPPTAALYVRISQDREGAGLGVERQTEDCTALAARLGWTVTKVFTDNDVSAYSGKRRPAYRELLDAIERGEVAGVIAWHPDRLHRSPAELEEFIALVEEGAGVVTHTVQAGRVGSILGVGASDSADARRVGAVRERAQGRPDPARVSAAARGRRVQWRDPSLRGGSVTGSLSSRRRRR